MLPRLVCFVWAVDALDSRCFSCGWPECMGGVVETLVKNSLGDEAVDPSSRTLPGGVKVLFEEQQVDIVTA